MNSIGNVIAAHKTQPPKDCVYIYTFLQAGLLHAHLCDWPGTSSLESFERAGTYHHDSCYPFVHFIR